MKKIIKNFIMLIMVISLMGVSMSQNIFAQESSRSLLDVTSFKIEVRKKGVFYPFFENGEIKGQDLKENDTVRFTINWEITKENMEHIVPYDSLKVKLPSEYFNAKDSEFIDIKGPKDEVLGTWRIKNGYIELKVSELGKSKQFLSNGVLSFLGTVDQASKDVVIDIGGVEIPPFEIKPDDKEYTEDDGYPYYKHGYQSAGDEITWEIGVNAMNQKNIYENQNFDKLKNVILTDDMSPTMEVIDIDILFALKVPLKNGKMSNEVLEFSHVTDMFDLIESTTDESYDDFATRIKNSSRETIGIYNKKSVIINFKDLPNDETGGLKLFKSDESLEKLLDDYIIYDRITEAQKEVMLKKYGLKNPVNGQMISFTVLIKTKIQGPSAEYKNKVKITYDDTTIERESNLVDYVDMKGSVIPGEAGDVVILKLDKSTGKPISNAKFKLQKKSLSGFNDYLDESKQLVKSSDSNGYVSFSALDIGEYKIIEVEPASGYSKHIEFENGDQFEIKGTETKVLQFKVFNTKNESAKVSIKLNKNLLNASLEANQFEFELLDSQGNVLETVGNAGDGSINFTELEFSEAGTFVY
ncbi:prealbumin-like fold domain-containing protein, partial [Erysipelothrix urinaevulpis]|uniref:prealbumin-like fold domain-containing protein n=1 Tax=Erysipelothrix urinaevulpis TaxID=2683717 RepID=UPI001916992C